MGQRKAGSEAGFTVIEVVIAAAVMFFVLTAIIGLMGASSNMTVQAKQRAIMTNTVASYLDKLRVTPWDEVQTPPEPVVITINNIQVTLNINVETRQEEGQDIIKVIRVQAVSTLNGASQMYETSVAMLRNPNFNRTLKTDPDAPVVYFMSEAPDDDGVIWADQQTSGPIFLKTKAFSPVDKIKEVRYDITGRTTFESLAIFTPSPTVQSYYSAPGLNTTAEGLGDGFQTASVTVVDEHQRSGTVKRRFIVDNLAPSSPGTMTIAPMTSSMVAIEWGAATDGGTAEAPNFASHYECQVSVEPTQGQPSTALDRLVLNDPRWLAGNNMALAISNDGPIIYEAVLGDELLNAYSRAVPPFSRVEARVRASSPRGLTNGVWVDAVQRGYTRPEIVCDTQPYGYRSLCGSRIWGVGSDKGTEYALDLYVSRAAFQRGADNPSWEIQYQSALTTPTPTGWQTFTTAPSVTAYDGNVLRMQATRKFLSLQNGEPLYFRVKFSGYTARRDGGGAVPTMFTNAAGPTLTGTSTGVTTFLMKNWAY